jgi:hypothetical protein
MTPMTNARIAGLTYLLYIGLDFPTLFMSNKNAAAVLTMFGAVNALVLAVALYGVTREVMPDLALLAMVCRVGEGILGASQAGPVRGGFFFAVGSTIFCYLLLRGRLIPTGLAWLGLGASVLLVVLLPATLGGVLHRPFSDLIWAPMAAFEIPAGFWLIMRGVRMPTATAVLAA